MMIDTFCAKHHACRTGWRWAIARATTMEELWTLDMPIEWRIWIVTRPGVCKNLREVAIAAIRKRAPELEADLYTEPVYLQHWEWLPPIKRAINYMWVGRYDDCFSCLEGDLDLMEAEVDFEN